MQDNHVWSGNKMILRTVQSFPVPPSLQTCFLLLRSHPTCSTLNIFTSSSSISFKAKENVQANFSSWSCCQCEDLRQLETISDLTFCRLCHGKSFHLSATPLAAASCNVSSSVPLLLPQPWAKQWHCWREVKGFLEIQTALHWSLRINGCSEYAFPGLMGKWSGRCRESSQRSCWGGGSYPIHFLVCLQQPHSSWKAVCTFRDIV